MDIIKGALMREAEERISELDDIEEPSNADLNAIDDETIEKMMEELSIDALLEEIYFG